MEQETIMGLDYNELRKQLKSKRLSAAGKKTDLQKRLLDFFLSEKVAEPVVEQEEEEEETMDVSSPAVTNRTHDFTHEQTPTNQVNLVLDEETRQKLCEEYGIDDHSFHIKPRNSAARTSARKSIRKSNVVVSEALPTTEHVEENREKTPTRLKAPKNYRDHFAKIHEKQNEKMESILDHQEKVLKRHQELTQDCPTSIKRLATPKSVKKREPLRQKDWKETNPENMTFKFGEEEVEDFKQVAKPKSGTPSSVKKTAKREHRDVKQITRVGGYTPHTFSARKKFIDTTKLTDREYDLALEEGLIPGKSARESAKKPRRGAESKKRRDDIIALKRKLRIE